MRKIKQWVPKKFVKIRVAGENVELEEKRVKNVEKLGVIKEECNIIFILEE